MGEDQEAADFDGCREDFHRKGAKVAEGREAGMMKGEGLWFWVSGDRSSLSFA
jgi:hypothetical protein